eukprot:751766-Hanusia_phi.AAC.2
MSAGYRNHTVVRNLVIVVKRLPADVCIELEAVQRSLGSSSIQQLNRSSSMSSSPSKSPIPHCASDTPPLPSQPNQ